MTNFDRDFISDLREKEGEKMTQIYENLSTQDADIELTDYSPTDKLLLTIDTLNTTIELVMTKDQLQQLRDSIAHTTEEAKEEEAEFKK